MLRNRFFFGFLALVFASATGLPTPAAAEPGGAGGQQSSTHELAAQARPHITIHPRRLGPNAKRYCRSWLAKEYRVSGPVIVPQMRCYWN
jgi:hypothetical protein